MERRETSSSPPWEICQSRAARSKGLGARTSESAAGGSRSKGACLPNGWQARAGAEFAELKGHRAELWVLCHAPAGGASGGGFPQADHRSGAAFKVEAAAQTNLPLNHGRRGGQGRLRSGQPQGGALQLQTWSANPACVL